MNTTNREDTARRDILGAFTVPTLRQLSAAAFAKAICDLDDDEDCVNLVETLLTFPPAYLKNVLPELPWNDIKCLLQSNVDQYQDYLTSDAMNQAVALEENRLCALCT